MFKKIIGIMLACVMCISMSICVSAEESASKINEIHPISSNNRSSSFNYGDFSITNGYTMLLGNSSTTGYFYVDSGTTVVLTTKLSSNQTNLDMGYYYNGSYTECNWTVTGPSWGKYTYTCSMPISTAGYYKFFISNNTANTLTFTGTSVTY